MNLPGYVQFETNTTCNQHCTMCPHDKMKKRTTATDGQIIKIINELVPTATEVCPFLMQDPLLEPRLIEILMAIKETNQKAATSIYATMHNMSKEFAKELLESMALDVLHISYYGKKWQPGLDEKKTEQNIRDFVDLRRKLCLKKPKIEMHYINELPMQREFYQEWYDIVDSVRIVPFDTFHGDINEDDLKGYERIKGPNKERKPCSRIYNTFNVHSNGNVVPCCLDYDEIIVVGNINEESAIDIWNGKRFNAFRKLHEQGLWNNMKLCKDCMVWEWE